MMCRLQDGAVSIFQRWMFTGRRPQCVMDEAQVYWRAMILQMSQLFETAVSPRSASVATPTSRQANVSKILHSPASTTSNATSAFVLSPNNASASKTFLDFKSSTNLESHAALCKRVLDILWILGRSESGLQLDEGTWKVALIVVLGIVEVMLEV